MTERRQDKSCQSGRQPSPTGLISAGASLVRRINETIVRYPLVLITGFTLVGGELGLRFPERLPTIAGIVASVCVATCLARVAYGKIRRSTTPRQARASAIARAPLAILFGITTAFVTGGVFGSLTGTVHEDTLSQEATRQGQPIAVRGLIESAAVWTPVSDRWTQGASEDAFRTQWRVRCTEVLDGLQWRPAQARTRLSLSGRIKDLLPGDRVEIHGQFRAIMPPTNPGMFDFAEHQRRAGILTSISADDRSQVQRLSTTRQFPLARFRAEIVNRVDTTLRQWLPADQAPLAAALVFGQRQQVDWEQQQELMSTGTLHMLAISGMHVEIVAGVVILFCWVLPLRPPWQLTLLLIVCAAYAALAAGKPPVIRAATLVMVFAVGQHFARRVRLSNLLAIAALLLFFIDPHNLHNVGVHLSFLAVTTIGVFVISPSAVPPGIANATGASERSDSEAALRRLLKKQAGYTSHMVGQLRTWAASMLRLSFWVWLMSCPLVWSWFHVVAPISIALNLLIAIPLGLCLISGLATGLLGWISPVGWLSGQLCSLGLTVIQQCVAWGNSITWGHLWLAAPPVWWCLTFYLTVFAWLGFIGNRRTERLGLVLLLWVVLGVGLQAFGPRGFSGVGPSRHSANEQFAATFLDVGHGTSVILEMPDNSIWLYDAGRMGDEQRSYLPIASALWELGTARIDTLFISHADADHYNAMSGLLDRFAVGRVISTPQFWQSSSPHVQDLIAKIRRLNIEALSWSIGAQSQVRNCRVRVLHPRSELPAETDNASSLCLLFEYQSQRMLLPGDLDGSGMGALLNLPPRPCHILMAPHHGSLTSDPVGLVEWCRPEMVVISGNHRAASDRVVAAYAPLADRLAITFRDGAVRHQVDAEGRVAHLSWGKQGWREIPKTIAEPLAHWKN